jgi:hypothetical protein
MISHSRSSQPEQHSGRRGLQNRRDQQVRHHEVRVKSIQNNTVYLETSDITQVGYQALPLQDTYSQGRLFKALQGDGNAPAFLYLEAASEGEWANGASTSTGLYTKVRPGSDAGSKKIEVYWNATLVETFDNLSNDADSDNYYTTRINDISQYIYIKHVADAVANRHAANTVDPWDSTYEDANLSDLRSRCPWASQRRLATLADPSIPGANGASATDADLHRYDRPDRRLSDRPQVL